MSQLPKMEKGPLVMDLMEGLKVTLFPKMEPGQPSVDIIRLDVTQYEGHTQTFCMTPAEALQVAIGLQSAVQLYLYNQKEYRSQILTPQNRIAIQRQKAVQKKRQIPPDAPMKSKEYVSIRKKIGVTQAQLAKALGISIKTVQVHEQGRGKVPVLVARLLRKMASDENFRKEMLP